MRQGYPRRFAPQCKHPERYVKAKAKACQPIPRRPEARYPNLGGSGVQRAGEVPNREQSTILARDVANQNRASGAGRKIFLTRPRIDPA